MANTENEFSENYRESGCSCCNGHHTKMSSDITRREFVRVTGTGALATVALPGLTWSMLRAEQTAEEFMVHRQPLVVKPILTYEVPVHQPQTSWRSWGGIRTEKDALEEVARIQGELKTLNSRSDFQVNFLPVSGVRTPRDLNNIRDRVPGRNHWML